jgi:hypothetical protein
MTSVSALVAIGAGFATAARAHRALEAEALAVQRLDALGLLTDQEVLSIPDSVASGRFEAPLDEYAWTTESSPFADQAGVFSVDITIEWPAGAYVLRTFIYRRPLAISAAAGGGGE